MTITSSGSVLTIDRHDIDLLRSVCVMPDAAALLDRLAQEHGYIGRLRRDFERRREAQQSILQTWSQVLSTRDPVGEEGPDVLSDLEGPGRFLHLFSALSMLSGVMDRESDTLELALHRPKPEQCTLTIQAEHPVMLIQPGSLDAGILKGPITTAGKWVITLALKNLGKLLADKTLGPAGSVLADLRQRQSYGGRRPPLEMLQELPRKDGRRDVIVFVHGLFSTDLGTFDPLVEVLRKLPGFARVEMVGFPHNPLESVTASAQDLVHWMKESFHDQEVSVAFVAHHRGGLVVRAAALELAQSSSDRMRLLGCVTFGTPHRGVAGVKNAYRTLGNIFRLMEPRNDQQSLRGFMQVTDLLRLLIAMGDAELGLGDMLEVADSPLHVGPRPWLQSLDRQESDFRRSHEGNPALPIHAIGGYVDSAWPWRLLCPAGDEKNDWLVPVSSSAPEKLPSIDSAQQYQASHTSYFHDQTCAGTAASRLAAWFDISSNSSGQILAEGTSRPTPAFPKIKIPPRLAKS